MDNIKFVVEGAKSLQGVSFKFNDVSVYLNDKKLPHELFNAAVVLPVAKYHMAEFDLFTCSCGVPGCAGFHESIIQKVKDGVVTWTFPDLEINSYKVDKEVYHFEEKHFKEAFSELISKMKQLEKEEIYHTTLLEDDSLYNQDSDRTRFAVKYNLEEAMQWYDTRYQANQNLHDMLEENYPDLMSKEFKYTYEGQEGKYFHTLPNIVCRVLNQFPEKVKEKAYLNKCKKVVEAIIEFMNGKNEKIKKFAYDSYEKHDMSSDSLIYCDFDNVQEENFDFDKMGLIIVKQ